MGRIYTQPMEGEKYVDRLIDVDILRYNNMLFISDRLNIPHHQNFTRGFVKELIFI